MYQLMKMQLQQSQLSMMLLNQFLQNVLNLVHYQNRLDHTINNLGTSSENLTAAESRIRDVDYALAA